MITIEINTSSDTTIKINGKEISLEGSCHRKDEPALESTDICHVSLIGDDDHEQSAKS